MADTNWRRRRNPVDNSSEESPATLTRHFCHDEYVKARRTESIGIRQSKKQRSQTNDETIIGLTTAKISLEQPGLQAIFSARHCHTFHA